VVDKPALKSRRDGGRSHHRADGENCLNDGLTRLREAEEKERLAGDENCAASNPLENAAKVDPGKVG
jgi:hypothetical protein